MILSAFLALLSSALIATSTPHIVIEQETARPASTDRAAEVESLYRESISFYSLGIYRLGDLKLFEAVELWQQSRQNERAVEALLQRGDLHKKADRWQYALQCYKRLLKFPSLPNQARAAVLNSIATLYLRLHQFRLASDYFQQALDLSNDAAARLTAFAGLAAVSVEEGKKQQARNYIDQARRLARQVGNQQAEAESLLLIGQIWQLQNQSADARQAFEEALSLYRKGDGNKSEQALLLSLLSDLHLASDTTLSLKYAMEALKLSQSITSAETHWRSYLALARAQRAMRQKQDARRSYLISIGFIEKARLDLSSDAFKIDFLEEGQAVYRELVDLLIEEGKSEEAFGVAENARSRATLDLLAQSRLANGQTVRPGQNQNREETAKKISLLNTQLRSARLDPAQRAQLEEELKKAQRQLEESRLEVEMYRLQKYTRPANLKRTQEKILRPGEALIEFFLGEDRSHLWLISQEQSFYYALPARREIEEAVRRYTRLLAARPNSFQLSRDLAAQKKMAAELFGILLGQIADKLSSARRLIIAPDGLLYYLPFETLTNDGRYLVEQFDIAYTPSASVLGALEKSRPETPADDQMEFVAFGDPDFGSPSATTRNDLLSDSWVDYRLDQLPGTKGEVVSISEFFPSNRRRIYLGRAATEEALKRESLTRCRRLHLATHGLIDERFPARSGILLTLDRDPAEDGFLDVEEIAGLEIECELVVLSACQTGRGRLTGGEGVVGLARAFLYAGARSVVVSLWNVSDISAAAFMRRFYRHLAAKENPVASLRQAKMEMILSDKAERHPYYWSAFLIVGQAD